MLLSAVSSFFSKLILTNNDGHFECFSLKNKNIRTYLETSAQQKHEHSEHDADNDEQAPVKAPVSRLLRVRFATAACGDG